MAKTPSLPRDVIDRPGATSANETLVDLYMERAVDLLRLEAGTRDKVVGLLDTLEKQITASIATIDPTGPAALSRSRLVELLSTVDSSIRATYRTSDVLMGNEIRNVADTESTWTGNALNSAMQADFATVGLTRGVLETLVSDLMIQGAPSSDWWGRQAQGLSNRFADEMRSGIALGESNGDLISRVAGTTTETGLMDVSRSSAERLVRASVQTVANAARNATYADNSDLISALMWHATLDTRTTEMCMARDGEMYSPTTHDAIDGAPPWLQGPGALHWGCRSTSIPVLKSWQDLGVDADDVPHTTRASMDGQVPASTTFESWLKKQTPTRQDTALGVGKAQLFRDGKITLRNLLNQSGRPLTTEDLKAKYANTYSQ